MLMIQGGLFLKLGVLNLKKRNKIMKKIVFKSIKNVVVKDFAIEPLKNDEIRVKHLYSLVSAGTELLSLTGMMGDVSDIIPGYSSVGKIVDGWEGTAFVKDQIVLCCGKHTSMMDYSKEFAAKVFIPLDEQYAKQATFLPLGKVALHGLQSTDNKPGQWIVVFGLGIVGNLSAQLAKLYSGGRVLAIDPIKKRREIAEKLGIKTLDPMNDNIIEAVKDITGGGADIVIETSGHPEALNKALQIAAYKGKISVVAGHYGKREVDLKTDFQNKELSIIGARRVDLLTQATHYDKLTVLEYYKHIYELITNGDIIVDPLITHCINVDKGPEMYERLLNKDEDVLGVVFDWTK